MIITFTGKLRKVIYKKARVNTLLVVFSRKKLNDQILKLFPPIGRLLVKLDFIETRLEAPQQSPELDTGVKLTRNQKIKKKWQFTL